MPTDYAGNTIATARNLGTLTATTQTFTDWVGSTDTDDYYRFTLAGTSSLRLSLTGLSADADVVLYAADGITVRGRSPQVGSVSETININGLAAGTYYARVLPFSESANYSLAVTASIIPDNAGNTIAAARNIGALTATTQTFTDWVGTADTNDFYRFTTASTSNLRVNLTGLAADANVVVYASNGTTVLGTGASTGVTSEAVAINNLAAGTYYARVYPGVTGAQTNYSLALTAQVPPPADNAGNTTTAARNIGALTATTQTFTDWVGTADTNDYYKFTTASTSNLRVNLTGLAADANVMVYASNGTMVLGTGANTGVTSEAVAINNLVAGTYYARVYPGVTGAQTNYSISLAALVPPDNAGNTTTVARNIGALTATTQTFTDWVGTADTNDYYRFTTASTSNLRVNLTGLAADANVVVYAGNGTTVVGTGANTGVTSEAVAINNLAAGTYYARVYPGVTGAQTNYSLALTAQVPPPADNAGNTIAAARNIGALTATTQTFTDWVGTADTNDYYQFTTASVSNLRLILSGMSANANFILYAAGGNVISHNMTVNGYSELISVDNVAAGTYYLLVNTGSSGAQNSYSLSLAAQVPTNVDSTDYAGNTIATARDVGTLTTTTRTFSDWLDNDVDSDSIDYYRFTLSGTQNVSIGFTGMPSADGSWQWEWGGVDVYSASGAIIGHSNFATDSNITTLNINNLATGTYYVRARGDAYANYNIALTATTTTLPTYPPQDLFGNSASSALDLGPPGGSDSAETGGGLIDWVGTTDINDYLRLDFVDSRNLNLTLTGMSANANLMVYAANGTTVLASSTNAGSSNEAVNLNVTPGTYYLRVQAVSESSTYYELNGSARPTYDTAGNTVAVARNIGILNANAQYFDGWVGDTDSDDYYRFTLNDTRSLFLNLIDMNSDADVVVYGTDGVTIRASSHNRGGNDEVVEIDNLAAGTYYVRVYRYAGSGTDYSLSLSAQASGESSVLWGYSDDDNIYGYPGDDIVSGGPGDDRLSGEGGNDTLSGNTGNDILTGGIGADIFRFETTVNSGIDTITDFQSGTDKIQVVSPNFANIPVGTLATNRLVAAGTTLTTGNAVFLYNGTTGGLSFDHDGNGSAAAVQIATLTGHPTLAANYIMVMAA